MRVASMANARTVVGRLDVVDVLLQTQTVNHDFVDEGRVAEVVRHHDRRVQRAEVERRDRHLVERLLRLDNRGAFVLFVRTCA